MEPTIPESHRDLLDQPIHAVFTTIMPDGQPQNSVVWCDYDGMTVRVATTRESRKGRNMQANPKVTLLVVDPQDPGRWIEVRGEAEITETGALEHLDELTCQYTSRQHYYDGIIQAEQQAKETRIICKIRPKRVTLDAVH